MPKASLHLRHPPHPRIYLSSLILGLSIRRATDRVCPPITTQVSDPKGTERVPKNMKETAFPVVLLPGAERTEKGLRKCGQAHS